MLKSALHRLDTLSFAIKKRAFSVVIAIFRYALILCISFMILYPLLTMISRAFTHPEYLGSATSIWIPVRATFDNIIVAATILNYPTAIVYTFFSTAAITTLQIFGSAFAGYSLSRLKFRGSGLIFALVILTIIVPPATLMLPQYILFKNFDLFGLFKLITGEPLNLLGKPVSMFMLAFLGQGLSGGLFIYIFRQFFMGVPKELEEAAYVDGSGFPRTFFKIVLPSSQPAFLTVGVLSFVWNWNDSYFPSLFNPTKNLLRMQLNQLNMPSGGGSSVQLAIGNNVSKLIGVTWLRTQAYDVAMLSVAALLVMLPLIVGFVIVQKRFVESIERSGIVG